MKRLLLTIGMLGTVMIGVAGVTGCGGHSGVNRDVGFLLGPHSANYNQPRIGAGSHCRETDEGVLCREHGKWVPISEALDNEK